MWILLISLSLPILALSSENICKESPFDVCPLSINLKNIESRDDVKAFCPKMINQLNCLDNYNKKCGDDVPLHVLSMEGEFESNFKLTIEICDETSLLHAALMENLKCLKTAILVGSNDACYNEEQNAIEEYKAYLYSEDSADEEKKDFGLEYCLEHLHNTTCFVEDIADSCGMLAKDAMVEVLDRSYYLRIFCHSHRAKAFGEDIGRLKMTDAQKEILEELVGKILENGME